MPSIVKGTLNALGLRTPKGAKPLDLTGSSHIEPAPPPPGSLAREPAHSQSAQLQSHYSEMFKTFSSQMDEQMEHTFGLLNEKIHDIKQSSLVTGMAAGAGLVGGLGAGTLSGIISAKYILSHVDEPATASDHPQGDISGSAADDPSHLWTVA